MSLAARIKHQIATYGRSISLGFVIIGLVAMGGAGFVYTNPPVEEIPPTETDVQTFENSVDTSAVVVNGTGLFEEGEVLRNSPAYFTNATPTLRLSAVARVPANRPVTVRHRLVLRQTVTVREQVLRERPIEILGAGEATVEDGEYRVNASLDIPRLNRQVNQIRSEISAIGTLTVSLQLETTYATQSQPGVEGVESIPYEGSLNASSPITLTEQAYWINEEITASQTEQQRVGGGQRVGEPNILLVAGLGALGVLGLVLGIGVWIWSQREVDLYQLELEIDRSQYGEWISEGEFPARQGQQYVYINTLGDLVDVAIDTNKRVIYDADVETYSVIDGDLVYYHAADPTTVDSWLDLG